METVCAAPLYRTVENGLEISTRSCSQVLYDIGNCDASYLYLNERFLYTFACPIEPEKKEEKKEEIMFLRTTTLPPLSTTTTFLRENSSLLRGRRDFKNESNKTTTAFVRLYNNSNETLENQSAVFVYSIERERGQGNKVVVHQSFAVTLIVIFTTMSVLSAAVLLYFRNKKKKGVLQKRPSSIMPEIIRSARNASVSKEVKAVLNKIIKTICRLNGEEPYRQRAPNSAPETPPPVPPRPPRQALGKRKETLEFLRQTNPHTKPQPHSTIQSALQKPAVNLSNAGQRRADILKREAELERRRQDRRKNSKRFQRIVRLRELRKNNGQERSAKKEEEAQ